MNEKWKRKGWIDCMILDGKERIVYERIKI